MLNNKFSTEKIRKTLEEVKEEVQHFSGLEMSGYDVSKQLESERIKLKALTEYLVDELHKPFKWQKCKRKNGTEFLKLITWDNDAGGYIEVGRFNMSKCEYIQNNWNLNDIYDELKD